MRPYYKWLTALGIVAAIPGTTFAGPFSFLGKKAETQQTSSTKPAKASRSSQQASNQKTAESIAQALRKANLAGYDIEIQYQNGIAVLEGVVASPQQKFSASKAVSGVKGVTRVENRLEVVDSRTVQQATAQQQTGKRVPIRRVNLQEGEQPQGQAAPGMQGLPPGIAPGMQAPPAPGAPTMTPIPGGGYPPPGYGPGPGGPGGPMMGPGGPMGSPGPMMYNQPNMPANAWPAYAQYPNYAAVTYPKQYSASAFPYIGPFYPYPQVPLGWRKAQLEWDDGYWNLNFRPRTEKWWWFLDYRNW